MEPGLQVEAVLVQAGVSAEAVRAGAGWAAVVPELDPLVTAFAPIAVLRRPIRQEHPVTA